MIAFFNSDVVVSPSNVELREPVLPNELIDQFLDQRYWVFILYCILVELAIILYWSELAILLFDEEEGGSIMSPPVGDTSSVLIVVRGNRCTVPCCALYKDPRIGSRYTCWLSGCLTRQMSPLCCQS